ncbi:hypothetical protein FRC03_005676 [Tulasnella sp. 419]|nr:hypothetical protein FRC03_005676 [Tulasnella sp. 419]
MSSPEPLPEDEDSKRFGLRQTSSSHQTPASPHILEYLPESPATQKGIRDTEFEDNEEQVIQELEAIDNDDEPIPSSGCQPPSIPPKPVQRSSRTPVPNPRYLEDNAEIQQGKKKKKGPRTKQGGATAATTTVTLKEPTTFKQAMATEDSYKWMESMKDEIKALRKMKTWKLAKLPKGRNCHEPVTCYMQS